MAAIPMQVLANVTLSEMNAWPTTYLQGGTFCAPTDSTNVYAWIGSTWVLIGSQPPTTSGQIAVGNGSGGANNVAVSGGITLNSSGVASLVSSAVLTALNSALGTSLANGAKLVQYALVSTTFTALNAAPVTLVGATASKAILPLSWKIIATTGIVGIGLSLQMGYSGSQTAVATVPVSGLTTAQLVLTDASTAITQSGITQALPTNTALTIAVSAATLSAGAINVLVEYDLI